MNWQRYEIAGPHLPRASTDSNLEGQFVEESGAFEQPRRTLFDLN